MAGEDGLFSSDGVTTLGVVDGALLCEAPFTVGTAVFVGRLVPLRVSPAAPAVGIGGAAVGVDGLASEPTLTFSGASPVLLAAFLIFLADAACVYLTARYGARASMRKPKRRPGSAPPAGEGALLPDARIPPARGGRGAMASDRVANDLNWPALTRAREEARRKAATAAGGGAVAAPEDQLIQERIMRPSRPGASRPGAAGGAAEGPAAGAAVLPTTVDESGLIPQERILLRRPLPAGRRGKQSALPELRLGQRSSAERLSAAESPTVQERIPLPPLQPRATGGGRGRRFEAGEGVNYGVMAPLDVAEWGGGSVPRALDSPALAAPTPARPKLPTLEASLSWSPGFAAAEGGSAINGELRRGQAPSDTAGGAGGQTGAANGGALPEGSDDLLPEERLRPPRRVRAAEAAVDALVGGASSPPPSPPCSPPGSPSAPPARLPRSTDALAWPDSTKAGHGRCRISDSSSRSAPRLATQPPLRRAAGAASTAADATGRPLPFSSAIRVLPRPSVAQASASVSTPGAGGLVETGQGGPSTTTVPMPSPPILPRLLTLALRHHSLTGFVFALQCAVPIRRGISSPMRCHVFWMSVGAQMLSAVAAVSLGAEFSLVIDSLYLALPGLSPVVACAAMGSCAGVLCASVFKLALFLDNSAATLWAAAWMINGTLFLLALVCASFIGARVDWADEGSGRVLTGTWLVGATVQWLLAEPLLMLLAHAWFKLAPTLALARIQVLPPDPLAPARAGRPDIPRVARAGAVPPAATGQPAGGS